VGRNKENICSVSSHHKDLFVFTAKVKDEQRLELYKCSLDEDQQQWVVQHISLERQMNFITGSAYQFNGDELLILTVPILNMSPWY
jgi:hypothetical protein